ncbi:MAG: choice-of-anchor Q domain-containing protein [Limisphaerales bacterium]
MKPSVKLYSLPATFFLTIFSVNAQVTHYVDLGSTNPVAPYLDWSTAATNIQTAIIAANPGDLVLVSNGLYNASGARIFDPSNQNYLITSRIIVSNGVTVSSLNGPAATIIQGNPILSCACLVGTAELNGFTLSNGTAYPGSIGTFGGGAYCFSTNALLVNCIICSNTASAGAGVFSGTLINCLVSNNVASGAESPSGQRYSGGGACDSVIYNCTLAGNTALSGGGAYNCLLAHCALIGNNASSTGTTGGAGGGAFGGVLNDCTLRGNTAANNSYTSGGGAAVSNVLNNCVIADNGTYLAAPRAAIGCYMTNCTICRNTNRSDDGSTVVAGCTLRNCILYYNGYTTYSGNDLKFCCTQLPSTYPPAGSNDISAAPLFVDTNNDFHLLSNSPCINSGKNAYVTVTTDMDGNPRIVGGTVDIGAYEYQTPSSVISYNYLQQYGLRTDGSVDYADLDGTGFNVYQDWVAGLNPTNPASVLAMLTPVATNAPGLTVSWQSVSGILYNLERSTNLATQPPFSIIRTNIPGQTGTTSYTDTSAINDFPYFYRVGVP